MQSIRTPTDCSSGRTPVCGYRRMENASYRFTMTTLLLVVTSQNASNPSLEGLQTPAKTEGIAVAQWNLEEYKIQITVMIFLMCIVVIKMVFSHIPYVSKYVPEVIVMIAFGIIFGAIIHFGFARDPNVEDEWQLTADLFFNYLLPPIVLQATYSLYNRIFTQYLGAIVLFSLVGTLLNFFIIGFSLFGLFVAGAFGPTLLQVDLIGWLHFASVIVSIDPVTMLSIFHKFDIELSLYYLVIGESLFNYSVTLILYQIMTHMASKDAVPLYDIGMGVAAFFTISLGGLAIGLVVGIISCLMTRFKNHLNAFTLIMLAYFAYIMALTMGWSGILSMIACGLVQVSYAFNNLEADSLIVVRKLMIILSDIAWSVTFLYLGLEVIFNKLSWDTGLSLWSLTLCLVSRTIVIFALAALVNLGFKKRKRISLRNQIIIIYSGMRGSIAYLLAVLAPPNSQNEIARYSYQCFLSATIFIIFFTVCIMGSTMGLLIKLLRISVKPQKVISVFTAINERMIEEVVAEMDTLLGFTGQKRIQRFLRDIEEKYIRKVLQHEPQTYDQHVMMVYKSLVMKLHEATFHPDRIESILKELPTGLHYKTLLDVTARQVPTPVANGVVQSPRHADSQLLDIEHGEECFSHLATRRMSTYNVSESLPFHFDNILQNAIINRAMALRQLSQIYGYEDTITPTSSIFSEVRRRMNENNNMDE